MKRTLAIAFTLLLTAGLALAQASGDSEKKTEKQHKKSGKATSADKVSLNPQPLPPGERKAGGDPASKVELNPQPLPPKERKAGGDPASKVELNPQPLPPKERKAGGDPASKVELNPQPLPPGERKAGGDPASKVELNPQPEPPGVQSTNKKKNVDTGKKKTPAPASATSPK